MYLFRKKKSKSKNKDREEQQLLKDIGTDIAEGASGSVSSGKKSKNEADAEKYYQNKTKSEIAFLKKKEESVSFDNILA